MGPISSFQTFVLIMLLGLFLAATHIKRVGKGHDQIPLLVFSDPCVSDTQGAWKHDLSFEPCALFELQAPDPSSP
jgi:hypothetical protein